MELEFSSTHRVNNVKFDLVNAVPEGLVTVAGRFFAGSGTTCGRRPGGTSEYRATNLSESVLTSRRFILILDHLA
jgi:hypothetical protein